MSFHRALVTNLLVLAACGVIAGSVFCSPSRAQAGHSESHQRVGWIPLAFLKRPIALQTGIGSIHEQVSTSSKEAQEFYDQGLAYLESYFWAQAARSFYEALHYDPKLAMADVGLSYAYSPMDFQAAEAALARAKSLSSGVTDRERRRIQIRALQLNAMLDPSKIERELAVRDALDDALAAYPDDVVFLLLRGVAQEPSPFADGQGCIDMQAATFFNRVLAIDPNNFAAHHFLIHCYENNGLLHDALPHAKAYAELAPNVPHAQHMYGHVLRHIGRMDQAIAQFLKTDDIERSYFQRENIPPWYDWHYAHNLDLLASSYEYLGQMKNAEKYFRIVSTLPAFTDYDSFNREDWPEFLLDRGRYAEALAAARALAERPAPLARIVGHALAGDALLSTGHPKEAATELSQADHITQTISRSDQATVRPYTDGLRAALLLQAGRTAEAGAVFDNVSRRIRAANGPDSWTQGLFHLEFLADVARRAGDWALASQLADAMYQRGPDYAGSHYALALVAQHNGASQTAAHEFSTATTLWNEADSDLPELTEVRRSLAKLGPDARQ
jgi:tetratricopeptide (TPR) repeat protein